MLFFSFSLPFILCPNPNKNAHQCFIKKKKTKWNILAETAKENPPTVFLKGHRETESLRQRHSNFYGQTDWKSFSWGICWRVAIYPLRQTDLLTIFFARKHIYYWVCVSLWGFCVSSIICVSFSVCVVCLQVCLNHRAAVCQYWWQWAGREPLLYDNWFLCGWPYQSQPVTVQL